MSDDDRQDNRCMIVEKESRTLVVAVDEFREFDKERRVLVVPPRKKET